LSTSRTSGPEETEALGARLASRLGPGDVVLVRGELGSGKTTLIRGVCRALGVAEAVTSPTFTIGHRYHGRVQVSHLDLYRLGDLGVEEPGLLDDYLTPDSVGLIEWPAAVEEPLTRHQPHPSQSGLRPSAPGQPLLAGLAPDGVHVTLTVELRHAGADDREIEVAGGADDD
jgi:tRNA threonylcarbamoyladenosine biosynthesis protein TsaE